MEEVREKEIDGIRFSVAPFKVIEAAKLHPYLIRLFGPFLAKTVGSLFKDGLSFEKGKSILDEKVSLDGGDLSQAITDLVSQLTENEYESLLRRMLRNVTAHVVKDGQVLQLSFGDLTFETSMNIVFTGKVFTIYSVLIFVLEVNYPDFLSKMGQGFGSKITKILGSELAGISSKNESAKSET